MKDEGSIYRWGGWWKWNIGLMVFYGQLWWILEKECQSWHLTWNIFGPWTYFLWPIRYWHYYFGHFGQLVKTKIKVIKAKEEKWLIKNKN